MIENNLEIFYNKNIQTDIKIINEIISKIKSIENSKMLVFGLGFDSELWYNATNKNTFFVENNKKYIDINKNINVSNIIYCDYGSIRVKDNIPNYPNEKYIDPPLSIVSNAPYDIIFVDGPTGYNSEQIGRVLPIYWISNFNLCKADTLIYVDDSNRHLENLSLNTFFNSNFKLLYKLNIRGGCSVYQYMPNKKN